jgi:hypothetical protein
MGDVLAVIRLQLQVFFITVVIFSLGFLLVFVVGLCAP